MYTLKDISTYSLIRLGTYYRNMIQHVERYAMVLRKYNIRDYEELEQAILSGNPDFQMEFFREKLLEAKEYLFKLNLSDISDNRFVFDAYNNSPFDTQILNKAEEYINGAKLLVSSPFNLQISTADRLKDLDVATIKSLLERVTFQGKNALAFNLCSFGEAKTFKVVEAVRFLEEQMLRIVVSTPDYAEQPDLFMTDAQIKREMIISDLARIIEEFLAGNEYYIFGTLTDGAKNKIREMVANPVKNRRILKRIIDMLADYTIKEELERGEARVRAMGRFH